MDIWSQGGGRQDGWLKGETDSDTKAGDIAQ